MKELTPEVVSDLTEKVDAFVELELGGRAPFICIVATYDGHLGLFTNRKANDEVIAMLETALDAARRDL